MSQYCSFTQGNQSACVPVRGSNAPDDLALQRECMIIVVVVAKMYSPQIAATGWAAGVGWYPAPAR